MILNHARLTQLALSLTLAVSLSGCFGNSTEAPAPSGKIGQQNVTCNTKPIQLDQDEALISIVATNDIHGSIQPKMISTGKDRVPEMVGGMAFWAGAMKSIREGVTTRYGSNGGVVLVDGGDQFQGTLLSNYSEGELMFNLMNDVGYDAAVPGNHDYDFGPAGWLNDQVSDQTSDKDPRGVIKGLALKANFPLLSANAYYKSSLKTLDGKPTTVDNVRCASKDLLDWSQARRPGFLQPFTIKTVAGGVRVAIIGLDNPETSLTTTFANVSDLCFRSALDEYKSLRTALDGAADVFVVVIHDGNINQENHLTDLLKGILDWRADGVDAVIGGHTHMVNKVHYPNPEKDVKDLTDKNVVYGIQSAANGERFGRIDLIYNRKLHSVIREKTRAAAGAYLTQYSCDPEVQPFCDPQAAAKVALECEGVEDSQTALTKVADAEKVIAPFSKRVLGYADAPIKRERDLESPLLNLLTDAFRAGTHAAITMINTGGVRTDLPAGTILYENLYQVSPFNNRAVLLSPMTVSTLVKILTRSAQSCGKSGAILFSGLRAVFHKPKCDPDADGYDKSVRLVTVALEDGTMLFDNRDPDHPKTYERNLDVVTLDFLATGGSGYDAFKEAPVKADLGIFREIVADQLAKSPGKISATTDGRWVDDVPPPDTTNPN